jgi:hypothetical protein
MWLDILQKSPFVAGLKQSLVENRRTPAVTHRQQYHGTSFSHPAHN